MEALKNFNWKRHLNTTIKVMLDFKVLGLIALNIMTLYGIGWDTIIRPNLETLSGRDKTMKEQVEALEKKQRLQRDYGDLEQKLLNLDTHMLTYNQSSSAKIVSVTEAAKLMEIALGKTRVDGIPPLQPPHDVRESVTLKPQENSTTLDILNPGSSTPQPSGTTQAPSSMPGQSDKPPGSQGGEPSSTLPVDRYDYDLQATGTYPALMDLLNQLVARKTLIKINKITITKATGSADAVPPNPKDYPEFPVKLTMLISLSMFLYEDNNNTNAAAQ